MAGGPQGCFCFCLLSAKTLSVCHAPWHFTWVLALNSCPHACRVSTLGNDPSLHPYKAPEILQTFVLHTHTGTSGRWGNSHRYHVLRVFGTWRKTKSTDDAWSFPFTVSCLLRVMQGARCPLMSSSVMVHVDRQPDRT